MTSPARSRSQFGFKARTFLAFVLKPEAPTPAWLEDLDAWLKSSPGFFLRRPVVLDASVLNPTKEDLQAFLAELSKRDIRILGIDGADDAAVDTAMPPLITGGRETQGPPGPRDGRDQGAKSRPLVIEKPVRSGQSIAYPYGDVTVLGPVSSGAEIIAGGSIHIYGALRGRVIAGSTGDSRARIFCQKLEAELLAINGLYSTSEDMDQGLRGRPAQAWLEGKKVVISALNN